MDEVFIGLIVLGLVLAVLGCTVVLPIIALVRTGRLKQLDARVARLEELLRQGDNPPISGPQEGPLVDLAARLERLETDLKARPAPPVPPPVEERTAVAAATPRPPPIRRREREEEPPWALPAELWPRGPDAAQLEAWIGRHALGWVAVLLLIFATGFFLKYAFENRWIGELGRVALGILAGVALCAGGLWLHSRGWRLLSQMATAAGSVLLYLATYAAFGYYHLIPQSSASAFLIVLVVQTAALAVFYEAPAVAVMAVAGGLLTPLLLHTDRDQYRSLFTYLLTLNAGILCLALLRAWYAVGTVGLLGSQLLFWLWHDEHYHPEKLAAALTFQAGLFVIYLAYCPLAPTLRRRQATPEDLVRVVLNAALAAAAGYVLLDVDYHAWLGSLSLGMALVHAALGWLVLRRRPDDAALVFVLVGTAMGFVAAVFPLQAHAAWIAVGWAAQGVVLWWFGLRVRARPLAGMGAVLLGLAVIRLLPETPWPFRRAPFVPLFNVYASPVLAVVAALVLAAVAARRFADWLRPYDRAAALLPGLGAVVLLWLVLSVETFSYFVLLAPEDQAERAFRYRTAHMALSVLWAAYAAAMLGLGFRLPSEALRWTALGFFGVTLFKVFFVDMAGLPGLYRVAAFLALAVMMAGAAWGYQKVQRSRLAAGGGAVSHEPG